MALPSLPYPLHHDGTSTRDQAAMYLLTPHGDFFRLMYPTMREFGGRDEELAIGLITKLHKLWMSEGKDLQHGMVSGDRRERNRYL
jgi:hypothetical protein